VSSAAMSEGFWLREKRRKWLETEQAKVAPKQAIAKKNQACQRCGFCCERSPCIPTPNELVEIAKFLDLPLKKMIQRYFVADSIGSKRTKYVLPAKETQKDIVGTFIPLRRVFDNGYCIFFKEGSCEIWPVRPRSARKYNCWKEDSADSLVHEALEEWENVDIESEYGIACPRMCLWCGKMDHLIWDCPGAPVESI
jgi:Fe-S-cluster containining protein